MTEHSSLILANLIHDWIEKNPELDVLTFVAIDSEGNFHEEIRTYQDLWDNAQRLASWLKAQGMEAGDTFAIVMANHPEFVELMVASSILGTVFVPIDPRTKGDKLRYMLDFAECRGAFVANYAFENMSAAWGARDDVWISTLGEPSGRDLTMEMALDAALPDPALNIVSNDPDSPMQILYTSGTTGDPKAILSSHRRFGETSRISPILGLSGHDRPYTGLSFTHANAQMITLGNILAMGLRGVVSRKFTKSRLWDITRHYGCTFFSLLGGMATAIYAAPHRANDCDNPVRRILSAGMPAAIWRDFASRFGVEIFEFYGAAEGGLTFNPPGIGPVGSCGRPPPSLEMKILDESGNECAAGDAGEIFFRNADGSPLLVTYFKNPAASREKTAGGWLKMGDVGHVDEDGWLFFHYRKGGGIRRNGDFINPSFIEKALSEIGFISDVFVYGIETADTAPGEKEVVAAIVPMDDQPLDIRKIIMVCRQKLDSNSVPSFLQIVAEIPKTASEKPQERLLSDAFSTDAENIHSTAPSRRQPRPANHDTSHQ
jgi:crotonobetaine/carnitine-CoA ligase